MSEGDCYFRATCRLCERDKLEKVIELTATPPGNHFLKYDELDRLERRYPLEVYFCRDCFHLQLGHVVSPEILYQRDYTYVSGTSSVFVDHLRDYAESVIGQFSLRDGGLVVDIGSNDGTCLSFFREAGYRVLGVDPAQGIAQRASAAGIETIAEFFHEELAARLREQYGPASLVTSHNACAHIDDLAGVVRGVRRWLAEDGLFVMEVGYLLDVYENGWFDTIYHEHLDYHSVAPLEAFFRRLDMKVLSVQRIEPQGGSIRVVVQKSEGVRAPNGSVLDLVELERKTGLQEAETFRAYADRINRTKRELSTLVHGLKASGKTIAGFGATTKATTLLTHFELGRDALDFIVDDNPLKQGLFSPLHHIPIVPADEMYRRRPDYVLVLAWNFASLIMESHARYVSEGGRFILPMPKAVIV